ncbi:hypothetical protein CDD81_5727 [Ophiocordyceps australis]|uniref:Copper transport protein n=1 Tax=Ophiocordyceps australis TaxID=1399860 RepID=A0A2C5Y7W9_9HYPO|nr:hypothetical protein CDD81_5727 [Ophiocordyceps australis]
MGGMDGMDGMDMGHGHGAMAMHMVFQNERATALYSSSWTPNSVGAYAGTCIFLILLAVVARLLVAAKAVQEARWLDREANRRYIAAAGKAPLAERLSRDSDAKPMTLISENGVEDNVVVVEKRGLGRRPWRFSVDPLRAVLDTLIVGIGYLLMLAVMTMNVGYFLSVLGGVFVGSLAVGRYSATPEH